MLYRPARKPWLRELVDSARERANLATAPTTLAGVRQMLKALKNGEAVGLLPDQVPPQGLGVWAPFFGRDAYTMTLSARLAQQTGAAILLAWGERLPLGPRLPRAPAALAGRRWPPTPHGAAAQVNAQMEGLIRRVPAAVPLGLCPLQAAARRRRRLA